MVDSSAKMVSVGFAFCHGGAWLCVPGATATGDGCSVVVVSCVCTCLLSRDSIHVHTCFVRTRRARERLRVVHFVHICIYVSPCGAPKN